MPTVDDIKSSDDRFINLPEDTPANNPIAEKEREIDIPRPPNTNTPAQEVGDFFGQMDREQAEIVNVSIDEAERKVDPNLAARIAKVQTITGAPAEVVASNIDAFEAEAGKEDFDAQRFVRTSPVVADWVRANSPFYSGMNRQDIQKLGNLEELLNRDPSMWRKPKERIAEEAERHGEGLRRFITEDFEDLFETNKLLGIDEEGLKELIEDSVDLQKTTRRGDLEFEEDFIEGTDEIGPGESLQKLFQENSSFMIPFVSSGQDIGRLTELYNSAMAIENGTATQDQTDLMIRYGRMAAAAERRGQSVIGLTSEIMAGSIPFAIELGLTAGSFNVGTKVGMKSAKKLTENVIQRSVAKVLKRQIPRKVAKFGYRNIGRLIGTGVHFAASSSLRATNAVIQEMTPSGSTVLGQDGSINFNVTPNSGKSFGVALTRGVYSTFVEVASEKVGGTVLFKAVDAKLEKAIFGWWGKAKKIPGKDPNFFQKAQVSLNKALKKGGVHGVFGEMGEEEVAKLMNAVGGIEPYRAPTGKELAAQFLAFGSPSLVRAGLGFIGNQEKTTNPQVLQDLGAMAEELEPIRENSPIEYKRIIKKITESTGLQDVFTPIVQFNQYWQSQTNEDGTPVDPREKSREILGDTKAYDEAMQTGEALNIPMPEYMEKVAPTEHNAAMSDISTFDPAKHSNAEMTVILDEMESNAQDQFAELEDQEAWAKQQQSAQRVRDIMRDQLQGKSVLVPVKSKKTGKTEPKPRQIDTVAADLYSKLYERVFRTMGQRTGRDPLELFEEFRVSVTEQKAKKERVDVEDKATADELEARIAENQEILDKAAEDQRNVLEGRDPETLEEFEDFDAVKRSELVSDAKKRGSAARKEVDKATQRLKDIDDKEAVDDEAFFFQAGDINSNNFKKWFKKSKVVDESGHPLIVYHGTPDLISESFSFDQGKIGQIGTADGAGFNFTPDEEFAEGFSGTDGTVISAYLSIKNPIDSNAEAFDAETSKKILVKLSEIAPEKFSDFIEGEGVSDLDLDLSLDFISGLLSKNHRNPVSQQKGLLAEGFSAEDINASIFEVTGHDGFFTKGKNFDPDIWVAFSSNQVKSVENVGTFDAEDSDIFFQEPEVTMDKPRGQVKFGTDNTVEIQLLENADLTTFLHESGHYFLEFFRKQATSKEATEEMKADLQAIKDWFKTLPFKDVLKELESTSKMLDRRAKSDIKLKKRADSFKEALKMVEEGGEKFIDEFIDSFGTNVDDTHRGIIMNPFHEMWARGFEKYLADPKNAPNKELQGMFHKFRDWAIKIYKDLLNLNVKLTQEVKDVMGRLLATNEEIESVMSEEGMVPLFPDPKAAGMSDALAAKYENDISEALKKAQDEISKQVMKAQERKKTKEYNDKKAEITPEVTDNINQERVYIMLDNIQKGKQSNGEPLPSGVSQIKLNKKELLNMIGEERFKNLPRPFVYSAKDGVQLDVAASMFGYETANEMVLDIELAPKKAEAIEEDVERQLAEFFGDPMTQSDIPEITADAIHNEKRAQILKKELDYLVSDNFATFKGLARKVDRLIPSIPEVRERAKRIIGDKNVSNIKPIIYQRGQAKASKTALDAFLKGDFEAVVAAKQLELLNHELYIESKQARKDVSKALNSFKPFNRKDADLAKTRAMPLVNSGRAILSEFGLMRDTERTAQSYIDYLKTYGSEDQHDVLLEMINGVISGSDNYKDVPLDKFKAMTETVQSLWKLARADKLMEIGDKKVEREQIEAELVELVNSKKAFVPAKEVSTIFGKMTKNEIKKGLLGAKAAGTRIISWVRSMDDGDPQGLFRRYIWNPIREGTTKASFVSKRNIAEFRSDLEEIREGLTTGGIEAPGLIPGRDFEFVNKAELLGAMLHTGNASNLKKLLVGRNFGEIDEATGELNTARWDQFIQRMWDEEVLTEKDYIFLQKTWDLFETMKPDAQKAHIKLYGFPFDEIVANTVETPFGKFKGGYAPAVVDLMEIQKINVSEANRLMSKDELENVRNSFMFPTTGRGFTKTRNEDYAQPLQMNLDLVTMHINKVARFSYIESAVRDVHRLLRGNNLNAALNNMDPAIVDEALIPWLERAARQRVSRPSEGRWGGKAVDHLFRGLRKRTAQAIMFGSVVNAAQQFTGIGVAATKVKPKYLRDAFVEYMKNPKGFGQIISEKSQFMNTRNTTSVIEHLGEIEKLVVNPTKFERVRDFFDQHALILQIGTQGMVDNIVWNGAYNWATEQEFSDRDAVLHADAMVEETQGGFTAESISRLEAGTPFQRMFMMFYGYFNMLGNTLGAEFSIAMRNLTGRERVGRLAYIYAMGFLTPAVIAEAISIALRGGPEPDEDDEESYMNEYIGIFLGSQVKTAAAPIPGANVFINPLINRFDDKWWNDDISVSPAVSRLESVFDLAGAFINYEKKIENGKSSRVIKDTTSTLSLVFGIPLDQFGKTAGFLTDVAEEEQEPEGFIDYTQGILTGRSGR